MTLRAPAASWCQMFLPDMELGVALAQVPETLLRPRYNIAPTQSIACVRQPAGQSRQLSFVRWGLVPPWAKDVSIGSRMINARSETVDSKRSFKRAFGTQRCLIPVDGYYEWTKTDDGKQPYLFHRSDDGVMAMAGLWETNQKISSDDQPLVTCTVLTTSPNRFTTKFHDRMPVLLDPEQYATWLDPNNSDIEQLKSLLVAAPEQLLQATPVSKYVNNARHDDPQCLSPPIEARQSDTLFDS